MAVSLEIDIHTRMKTYVFSSMYFNGYNLDPVSSEKDPPRKIDTQDPFTNNHSRNRYNRLRNLWHEKAESENHKTSCKVQTVEAAFCSAVSKAASSATAASLQRKNQWKFHDYAHTHIQPSVVCGQLLE